jgi:hypothetical protein
MTNDTSSSEFEMVKTCVEQAIEEFRNRDLQLLQLTVDERASTHRIACYLQKYFPEWHVDCEYNRKGSIPKPTPDTSTNARVKPDIIIHKRNTEANLLCIEAKKKGGRLSEDRKRLIGFTSRTGTYRYQFGLLLILSLKNPYRIEYEWFQNGVHFE